MHAGVARAAALRAAVICLRGALMPPRKTVAPARVAKRMFAAAFRRVLICRVMPPPAARSTAECRHARHV